MARILVQRLLASIIVLWGVVTLVFIILRLVPGDPASLAAGIEATPQMVEALRHQWGLDQPVYVQYALFLSQVVRADFGYALHFSEPAMQLVGDRIPATLQLAIPALGLAVLISFPLGVLAASRANSIWDRIISIGTLSAQSLPNYWVGLMLILVFARNMGVLPTSGRGTWQQMVMPVVTLALPLSSILARFVRTGVLEHLRLDYVRTARAKGLTEWVVYNRHIFKNILIPVVTTIGLQAGTLLGGSVVVETVFAWPGMGRLTAEAILRRDYPVVQAGVLVIALFVVLINLTVDFIYTILDPRVRFN